MVIEGDDRLLKLALLAVEERAKGGSRSVAELVDEAGLKPEELALLLNELLDNP